MIRDLGNAGVSVGGRASCSPALASLGPIMPEGSQQIRSPVAGKA